MYLLKIKDLSRDYDNPGAATSTMNMWGPKALDLRYHNRQKIVFIFRDLKRVHLVGWKNDGLLSASRVICNNKKCD